MEPRSDVVSQIIARASSPGFGAVHSTSQDDGPCRPGPACLCPHGVSVRCGSGPKAMSSRSG